jgi:hypothetical protein
VRYYDTKLSFTYFSSTICNVADNIIFIAYKFGRHLQQSAIAITMSTLSHNLQSDNFSGLVGVLAAASGSGDHLEVVADIEGEQETMPAHAKVDDDDDLDNVDSPSDHEKPIGQLPAQWKETMAQAARGVTDNTHREYIRYVFFIIFNHNCD